MGGGTGRLTGRDVKREPTMHVYIVSLYHGNPISAEPSLRKQTAPTATKTGQFLSCHFYHADFANRPVSETFSCKPEIKTSHPGKRPVPPPI